MMLVLLVLLQMGFSRVNAHGYLINPPARNSMWRIPFPGAPTNTDDSALNCGGRGILWDQNHFGQCGLCGDPVVDKTPRRNEHGGEFGKDIIGKTYTAGEIIDIEVVIKKYHGGFLELKICAADEETGGVTQECFDKFALKVLPPDHKVVTTPKPDPNKFDCIGIGTGKDAWCHNYYAAAKQIPPTNLCKCGKGIVSGPKTCRNNTTEGASAGKPFNSTTLMTERFYLDTDCNRAEGKYAYRAKLPTGLHCSRCVLQWTYITAGDYNNGCLGCGTQEWFRNCADINIV